MTRPLEGSTGVPSAPAASGAAVSSPTATAREVAARETAGRLLGFESPRFAHSDRVAGQAACVRHLLTDPWRSALVEAAWLHDIGYAPELVESGFHPIDGARWLKSHGESPAVCSLVAWHTRARTEARLRGLEDALVTEFAAPPPAAQSALTWADLTSSPTGERWTPETRISDILLRYGPESLVHKATLANELDLLDDARSVAERIPGPAGEHP